MSAVDLVVPGPVETQTGGYLYDARIFDELAALGWRTSVHALDSSFPEPTAAALEFAQTTMAGIDNHRLVVIDGLALTGLLPLLDAASKRLHLIALIHHPLADETGLERDRAERLAAAERAALALVPQIVVTSPWTRRRLGDYGVDSERIAVVEPGIDREPMTKHEPSSTLRLLSVATITPRKGHAVLIDALARCKHLDWTLRCAGSTDLDPDCTSALESRIDAAGLRDRVALLGELSPAAVRHEYLQADVFVLPSFLEGYGMALAEAIAHGLPVVSTTAGAIPDTVPAEAARLVEPGNAESLANVLNELMTDRELLETLGRGARTAAATVPSWTDAARQFEAVLNKQIVQ